MILDLQPSHKQQPDRARTDETRPIGPRRPQPDLCQASYSGVT